MSVKKDKVRLGREIRKVTGLSFTESMKAAKATHGVMNRTKENEVLLSLPFVTEDSEWYIPQCIDKHCCDAYWKEYAIINGPKGQYRVLL